MDIKTRHVDVKIIHTDGTVVFEKPDFEVPEDWSNRAATIVASKYATDDEDSALDVIDRVVAQIAMWGDEQGYFDSPEKQNEFVRHLQEILVDQRASFNSPVWFNCGVPENNNQMSACFILDVEDNMESILNHAVVEGMIFKAGSGAGVNVSKLRAQGEKLSNKGEASGPVSFMEGWDAFAGIIKSGGKVRRAAKLVCMDVDHPDIMKFIECKAYEEKKAKILIANGISPEEAYHTVFFQNANHSIRATDKFMLASDPHDGQWWLKNRGKDGKLHASDARDILRRAAETAWETGDPGIQFHDRMNQDNPVPSMGEIRSTNPCSEFSAIDNSSCNLASLNLIKYYRPGLMYNWEQFVADIQVIVTAMDILIDAADYPTPEIRAITIKTRPLGLGFTNLGALLMLEGLPYDSEEARHYAETITQHMTLHAYKQSIKLAGLLGPYEAYDADNDTCVEIAQRLTNNEITYEEIKRHGLRNSQLTLLAPTGTISFMMDCDTTGIEPLFALKSIKTLAGGGTMEIIPECVQRVIEQYVDGRPPGYYDVSHDIDDLRPYTIEAIPKDQRAILKTANEIHWRDHILMMAACQKHLNGAISKTINMPADCTVEDIEEAYRFAWEQGLKSLAIYRDGSKDDQPLTEVADAEQEEIEDPEEETSGGWVAFRRSMPNTRQSVTHRFIIGGFKGYVTVGVFEDGEPGELFIRAEKTGSTMQGFLDSFAIAISMALQYGVPLDALARKFIGQRFEPAGITDNEEIRIAASVMDYIFRWLVKEFGDEEEYEEEEKEHTPAMATFSLDGPPCNNCGAITGRHGTCYLCAQCGTTTGCS